MDHPVQTAMRKLVTVRRIGKVIKKPKMYVTIVHVDGWKVELPGTRQPYKVITYMFPLPTTNSLPIHLPVPII